MTTDTPIGSEQSGDSPGETQVYDGTACSLVSRNEAADAFGYDPGPSEVKDTTSPGATSCKFGNADPEYVQWTMTTQGGRDAYFKVYNGAAPGSLEDLTGLGEAAYGNAKFGSGFYNIGFYKGDSFVVIVFYTTKAVSPKTQALSFAQAAADRLTP
ncbi:MAG: hypothetical protein ABI435_10075 [Pseudolysinimonas sp.]